MAGNAHGLAVKPVWSWTVRVVWALWLALLMALMALMALMLLPVIVRLARSRVALHQHA